MLHSAPMLPARTLLASKYRLLRLIGEGGMGAVWEAEDERLGSRVAVKVLHPALLTQQGIRERFLQEARVLGRVRSEHVVHVIDIGEEPSGIVFFAMEYVEGESLAKWLEREGPFSVPVACELIRQTLEGISHAHKVGVLHRDMKPENLLVTRGHHGPFVRIVDFGIAKVLRNAQTGLTTPGMLLGTTDYMAPEQVRSVENVDERADIYSVGVILFELLTRQKRVKGDNPVQVALRVERGEVISLESVAPHLPHELSSIVERATAPDRENRYRFASEFRDALLPWLGSLATSIQSNQGVSGLSTTEKVAAIQPDPQPGPRARLASDAAIQHEEISIPGIPTNRVRAKGKRKLGVFAVPLVLALVAVGVWVGLGEPERDVPVVPAVLSSASVSMPVSHASVGTPPAKSPTSIAPLAPIGGANTNGNTPSRPQGTSVVPKPSASAAPSTLLPSPSSIASSSLFPFPPPSSFTFPIPPPSLSNLPPGFRPPAEVEQFLQGIPGLVSPPAAQPTTSAAPPPSSSPTTPPTAGAGF